LFWFCNFGLILHGKSGKKAMVCCYVHAARRDSRQPSGQQKKTNKRVNKKPLLDSSSYKQLYWVPVSKKPLLDSSSYKQLYWIPLSKKPPLDSSS
jgi:hypothetical protein